MKNPFAKKTADIKNKEAQVFVQLFKDLQTDSEAAAKQARKVKQILKNSKDIDNPQKIKDAAKELLQKPDSSFIARHLKMMTTLNQIAEHIGFSSVCDVLKSAKEKEEKAIKMARTEVSEIQQEEMLDDPFDSQNGIE